MGSNRRYPGHDLDRQIEEAVLRPVPVSLTPAELDLEHHPVTEAPALMPARAWVRFHEATIRPDCEVIAWTDRAVQVRWTMRGGHVRTAWVWASAVEPR